MQVFYVGCGGAYRPRNFTKGCRSKEWNDIVVKTGKPIVEICAQWGTQEEAWEHEIFLISYFKESGHPLVNKSNGGASNKGFKFSEESRAKQSLARIGKKPSKETREKLSKARLGKKQSVEIRAKLSKSKIGERNPFFGRTHSQQTKEKMKESLSGAKNPRFGSIISDETRLKQSVARKLLHQKANKYKCSECGLISIIGPLGRHQKASGHIGKIEIVGSIL